MAIGLPKPFSNRKFGAARATLRTTSNNKQELERHPNALG